MNVNHNYTLKDKGVSNTIDSLQLPRHRWYSYKEGFSPILVEHAISGIENFNLQRDVILDPFNGSGTVTLFSSINGYQSKGFEVNPFSSFISRVKETSLTPKEQDILNREKDILLKNCKRPRTSPLASFSTFSELNNSEKWLFNSSVLNSFEAGHRYLKSISNIKIKGLLKLAVINSVMDNCNAKKDGKCLRYKTNWLSLNYNQTSLIDSIEANIDRYLNDIRSTTVVSNSKISTGDSRLLLKKATGKFKLCITSPPYLNSFDYTDIYRPELFLGEFISSQEQLYNLRYKTLRSHINHKEKLDQSKSFGINYENIINSLENSSDLLWDSKIPSMIQGYFDDMKKIFEDLRKQADQNAELWVIVANSAYADLEIPTDLILAEIGAKTRWYLKEIGVLRYLHKRGSKYSPNISMLRESVIIFSTSPDR